jgi:hypothetical protein
VIWENEFFNRSFGRIYDVGSTPSPGLLAETSATVGSSGHLETSAGPVAARYVLTDGFLDVTGTEVASDPGLSLRLYRVDGPVDVVTTVGGIYPNGTWSSGRVTYTRTRCDGGRLAVVLHSDPGLFPKEQTVVAHVAGRAVGRVSYGPDDEPTLTVPLRAVAGTCTVTYDVAHTVVPGSADPRRLGTHILRFAYTP